MEVKRLGYGECCGSQYITLTCHPACAVAVGPTGCAGRIVPQPAEVVWVSRMQVKVSHRSRNKMNDRMVVVIVKPRLVIALKPTTCTRYRTSRRPAHGLPGTVRQGLNLLKT